MQTYSTAQLAKIIGIHPNTVRLYEKLELIPKSERMDNGYRVFTDFHIDVFKLARTAFQIEVLQSGLRKKIVAMVKTAATGDFHTALVLTEEYLTQVQMEKENAVEAIQITKQTLYRNSPADKIELGRADTAKLLKTSMDTLRNWELNGLLSVKRKVNGYRVYTAEDITRLKIIRSLRCANYSLEAILRMLSEVSTNPRADIQQALDTPRLDEDIISVCDKLLTSLGAAEKNAKAMQKMLQKMKRKY